MSNTVDIAIVGGGAAGIGAGRRAIELGLAPLVVEALPRLGGRAHTVSLAGFPVDLGCGWLHSAERNPLAALAEARGVTLDRSRAAWGEQYRDLHFPPPAQAEAWAAYERFVDRLASDPPPSDRASDALAGEPQWRPFIDGLSSFINGVETDHLSARDFTAYDSAASETNWRLPGGYGAFLHELAVDLPVALGTPVSAIREEDGIAVETAGGTIRARAAIVTVSTAVLSSGAIRLPAAAADHLHAATHVPLGLADKVFLSIADPDAIPPETHLIGRFDTAGTGSYYIRPFGRPMIEAFLGGAEARALESDDAAFDFAVGELRGLLGTDFANGLSPLRATCWGREPTILGSYSHALPGHADARAVLARPISDRLCLAGEACSPRDFSTAHGAWASGIAAADRIAAALAR